MKKKDCWNTYLYKKEKVFPFMMVEVGYLPKGKIRLEKEDNKYLPDLYYLSPVITPKIEVTNYEYKKYND